MKIYYRSNFVLHLHNAYKAGRHCDLRISIPNKKLLASFAIPKAVLPRKPGDKVLGIRTQNHGRYWIDIEHMNIPRGEYGAGTIEKIQGGDCWILGWNENTHITFIVDDPSHEKTGLNGKYVLIKFSDRYNAKKQDTYFLMKSKFDEKERLEFEKAKEEYIHKKSKYVNKQRDFI